MQLAIFLTIEQQNSLPKTIKIVHNFGNTTIIDYENMNEIEGIHCVLECTPNDFCQWVHEIKDKGVWITEGIPQLEQFIFHSKKEFKKNG